MVSTDQMVMYHITVGARWLAFSNVPWNAALILFKNLHDGDLPSLLEVSRVNRVELRVCSSLCLMELPTKGAR
jgi:hypothetical protein